MKARKGGNRLERLKNLCEVHGVLLDPEHPSNELVIDCNGNKYTVDKHFNMFDTDYLFSFYNNICISKSITIGNENGINYFTQKKINYNPKCKESISYNNDNNLYCGRISINRVA